MTLCNWCGQESQSEVICDWCKRPISSRGAISVGRPELEFLRDTEEEKPSYLIAGIVAVCVLGCGLLLFMVLKGSPTASAQPVATNTNNTTNVPPPTNTPPQRPSVAVNLPTTPPSTANGDSGDLQPTTPKTGGSPLGGGGRSSGPTAWPTVNIPINANIPRLVTIENANLTIQNLPGGKVVVGKIDMKNGSGLNVVDYRVELIWGATVYSMNPVTGRGSNIQPLDQRVIKVGHSSSANIVSQVIKSQPDGAPFSIRMQAWLDGKPNFSVDEWLLQR